MTRGKIVGYAGPMFASKSTALMSHLRRAELAGMRVGAFKPEIDQRYGDGIQSHDGARLPAAPVAATTEGTRRVAAEGRDYDVVGIDEVQFFPLEIIDAVLALRNAGKTVVWAGLDMDFLGVPFGAVPYLLALGAAHKLTAVCVCCGEDATHTYRVTASAERVVVGAAGAYEARCFPCWSAPQIRKPPPGP